MKSVVSQRKGARRKADVPSEVLISLAAGTSETVNLMEWLAADLEALACAVAAEAPNPIHAASLTEASMALAGLGILARLKTMGRAISRAAPDRSDPWRIHLAQHRSDLVRQWACYALNDSSLVLPLPERLRLTLPFAADSNMSVREAAWMAFRPYVAEHLPQALELLTRESRSQDENIRRFSVEVTRPRSVWGAHIKALKITPELALPLLENVKYDPSRYVRLAVGNWLNDASKSQPDWVLGVCGRWAEGNDKAAAAIIRRAKRTIIGELAGVKVSPVGISFEKKPGLMGGRDA